MKEQWGHSCPERPRSARPAALASGVLAGCCVAKNEADADRKLSSAYQYYGRFHNVFTDPGIVEHGAIRRFRSKQTMEQFKQNIIVCPAAEMIDRLKVYEDLGVDDFIMNVNIGHGQENRSMR